MQRRGGFREGAGRKKGALNLLSKDLREKIDAVKLITFLQQLANGDIPEASIGERRDAAVALLKKVLPDVRQQDINVVEDKKILAVHFNIPPRNASFDRLDSE